MQDVLKRTARNARQERYKTKRKAGSGATRSRGCGCKISAAKAQEVDSTSLVNPDQAETQIVMEQEPEDQPLLNWLHED